MRQTIALVLAATLVGCGSAQQYRATGNRDALRVTLRDQITDGMAMEQVQKLIGPGKEAAGDKQAKLVSAMRQVATRDPLNAKGGEADDRFLRYEAGASVRVYLQFRDDKLINYDPAVFNRGDVFAYNVPDSTRR